MATSKRLAVLIVSLFLIAGCATVGTVWRDIGEPEFQAENLPVRELRIAVYSETSYTREIIEEVIADTSHELERQVGIKLKIVSFWPIIWEGTSREERLRMLREKAEPDRQNFDMAIGFGQHTEEDVILMMTIGTWQAVIDDTYRRYIVTKVLSTYELMHEICHAFIFSHLHSETGLMQEFQFLILPDVPAINATIYLSPEDRKEVLKNKWRDFNKKPPIREDDIEDALSLLSIL